MQSVVWTSSQNQIECWKSLVLKRTNKDAKILVITPSPQLADIRRKKLNEWSTHYNFDNPFDIITISKFLADVLDRNKNKKNYSIFKKSDSILHLGHIYHKKFPQLSYQNFENSYKWFSEIRSYTVDSDLINSVVESISEETSQAINIFQFYFENNKIIDEHQAFSVLANNAELYFTEDEQLVFCDFVNLTGQQVDLINRVSTVANVAVFIPDTFKNLRNSTDWISWLENQRIEQHTEWSTEQEIRSGRNKFILYTSGDLQGQLQLYLQGKFFDNVLLIGENEFFKNHFISLPSHFYKNSIDIFNGPKTLIFEELSQVISGNKINISEFKNKIDLRIKKLLKQKTGQYREIKILQLFENSILKLEELTSNIISLDNFFLSVFSEIVQLDLPRVGLIPLLPDGDFGFFQDYKVPDFHPSSQNLIFFSNKFSGGNNANELPFPIYEKLANIGPMKNKDFEFARFLSEIAVVTDGLNTIFIPDEFEKNSPALKMIISQPVFQKTTFENFEKNHVASSSSIDPLQILVKKYVDTRIVKKNNFSFSELKIFRECPRKYFFKFIANFDQEIRVNNDLRPQDLGILEHLVIQEYFKSNAKIQFDEHYFYNICDRLFENYIKDKNITLSELQKLAYLKEIYNYSLNAVRVIERLCLELLESQISFEVPINLQINEYNFKGRIDCLIQSKNYNLILDFKRNTIPAKSEIVELEEIQVISYCAAIDKQYDRGIDGFSYFSLADNENNIYTFETTPSFLVEGVEIKKIGTTKNEVFNKLDKILVSVALHINSETVFHPTPSQKSCQFCFLSSVCSRGMS